MADIDSFSKIGSILQIMGHCGDYEDEIVAIQSLGNIEDYKHW